jgi:hypothetical protein
MCISTMNKNKPQGIDDSLCKLQLLELELSTNIIPS